MGRITIPCLLANALILQNVFPSLSRINPVAWTVALELQIYILFPILIALARRSWLLSFTFSVVDGYGITLVVRRYVPSFDLAL